MLRAGSTRFSVVDRLLEQIPQERILGVVLNRADVKSDDSYYYYSDRQRAAAAAAQAMDEQHIAAPAQSEDAPEMIYIEEDGVS